MRRPGRGVPLLAMLLAVTAWPASTPLAAEGQQQQARGEAVIRNQSQLDEYLRQHAASGKPTPLDAFSAGARERFLSDLVWGSKGLGGFNRGDLAEDLGDDQIRAVLGLFGSDMVAYAPPSRAAGIGIDRTGLTGISDLERRYTRFYHDANDAYASGDDATRSKPHTPPTEPLFPHTREPAALPALPNHDLRPPLRAASPEATRAARAAAAANHPSHS